MEEHQHQEQPENQAPTKEITIYCWKIQLIPFRVGHISMRLSDGTYISHWPNKDEKGLKSILNKPAAQMMFDDDVELEGREPDQVNSFPAFYLWETQIKRWWKKFVNDPNSTYNLTTQNCAHIVSKAILAGIRQKYHEDKINFEKRFCQRPMETLGEILSVLKQWPRENYLKFDCHRFIYNLGLRLDESLKDIWSFRTENQNIIRNGSVCINIDVFEKLKNKLETLLKEIENSTQELSVFLSEIYPDQEPAPANPMMALKGNANNFSPNIFQIISDATESDYETAISMMDTICGQIIYLHNILIEQYTNTVKNLFGSELLFAEMINL